MKNAVTAGQIIEALALKHAKDIFVPQCKTGPSIGSGNSLRVMDAWTIQKSWAHTRATCYEVKVSRSDFLADEKWKDYLPYCNKLYFACPPHLIEPGEVSGEAGLRWVWQRRVVTKKKAPHRDVTVPADVLLYILMWRAEVVEEGVGQSPREFWQHWLERGQADKELGYKVSRRIRELLDEARGQARQAQECVEGYKELQARLQEMGLREDEPFSSWKVDSILENLAKDAQLCMAVERIRDDIRVVEDRIRSVTKKSATEGGK